MKPKYAIVSEPEYYSVLLFRSEFAHKEVFRHPCALDIGAYCHSLEDQGVTFSHYLSNTEYTTDRAFFFNYIESLIRSAA